MAHSPETVTRGLTALALNRGDCDRTSRLTGIPSRTLLSWRTKVHRDEYHRISTRYEEALAVEADKAVVQRLEFLQKNMDAINQASDEDEVDKLHKLSSVDKNLVTSVGIFVDKSRQLRDKPTKLIEHRVTVEEIDSSLAKLGLIDGEATEIEDARVLDERNTDEGQE